MSFELFIGIDYSGAQTPTSRLPGLQVYGASAGGPPQRWNSPTPSNNQQRINWSRAEIAETLLKHAKKGVRFLAGIDHAFSFPNSYFLRYQLHSWPEFLADFVKHWPTDGDHVYVDFIRDGNLARKGGPAPGQRIGQTTEFRICEQWTSSAKSVFQFDVQGTVAKSTHAGIPWLKRLRDEAGDRIHFWPFDGWIPAEGRAVIAEVYPSIFRRRYPRQERTADEHDAYATACWLSEMDQLGFMPGYFKEPSLSPEKLRIAEREGWILGIS